MSDGIRVPYNQAIIMKQRALNHRDFPKIMCWDQNRMEWVKLAKKLDGNVIQEVFILETHESSRNKDGSVKGNFDILVHWYGN